MRIYRLSLPFVLPKREAGRHAFVPGELGCKSPDDTEQPSEQVLIFGKLSDAQNCAPGARRRLIYAASA